MTTINPAIVARIRKLMNLSKDGAASENEQEIAAGHAQRLMLEHNITVATVEASKDTGQNTARRQKEQVKGFAMYDWQRSLMAQIAITNFCYCETKQTWNGRRWAPSGHMLVGREENIIGAQTLYDYLRTTTERLAREYVGGDNLKLMSNAAMSFKTGCAERITHRIYRRHKEALAAQKASAQAANASGTALVPIMADFAEMEECANEDFRLGLEPGTTAKRRFLASLRNQAHQAVSAALAADDLLKVDDVSVLMQLSRNVAMDTVSAAGLETSELEELVSFAATLNVTSHVNAVNLRRDPKLREAAAKEAARSANHWRRRYAGSRKSIDRTAYNAGDDAGARVGLDAQVAGVSSAKRLVQS